MKTSPLLPLAAALLASLSAMACVSSDPVGAADEGDPDALDQEMRSSCTSPRRYFVTFRDAAQAQACAPIPGRRGQWLPEALFDDAPEDVQLSTCAYRWSGERYSRADRDAIAAHVGDDNVLAPACGAATHPDVGTLQPIPHLDIWGHAGSVGCDVCGVLRRDRVWVILPPERVARRQFEVQLDNGQTRAFQIENVEARALSITLPPAPAGASYLPGRVAIY